MRENIVSVVGIILLVVFIFIQFYRYFDESLFGRPHITSWLFILIPIFLYLQKFFNKDE